MAGGFWGGWVLVGCARVGARAIAPVAELVDAAHSKCVDSVVVQVRVLPGVLCREITPLTCSVCF